MSSLCSTELRSSCEVNPAAWETPCAWFWADGAIEAETCGTVVGNDDGIEPLEETVQRRGLIPWTLFEVWAGLYWPNTGQDCFTAFMTLSA